MSQRIPMRRGLTMAELMVIIAILLILASALMPTVNRSREAARTTCCKSNEKQLLTGLSMYVHDYDERLPPYAYLYGNQSTLLPALLNPYLKNHALWRCPTANRSDPYRGRPDDPAVDYGYNWSALTVNGRGIPYAKAASPVDTVVFVDAGSYLAAPDRLAPALGGSPPAYRHKGWVNVAWLDGHAKSVKPGILEANSERENGKPLQSGIDRFLYWNLH